MKELFISIGRTRHLLLFIALFGIFTSSIAQVKLHLLQGKHNKSRDSLEVRADTSVPVIITKIENYSYVIDHTNFLFRNQLNVSPIYLELNETEKRLDGFKSRLETRGQRMNLRSINSAIILLREIAGQLNTHKRNLANYSSQLLKSNNQVKKIISDPILKVQLADSILSEQLNDLLVEGQSLDSLQQQVLGRVNLLLNHVSVDLLQAKDIISDMGYLSIEKKLSMWQQEEAPLFKARADQYHDGLPAVFMAGIERSFKIIITYLSGKWKLLSFSLLLFAFLLILTVSNYLRIKKSGDSITALLPVHYLKRGLIASCIFAFLCCLPYVYSSPPMSFLHAVELLRLSLVAYILWPFILKRARPVATAFAIIWILFACDDILLESAFGERWILFLGCLLLAGICIDRLIRSRAFFITIKEPAAVKLVLAITLTFSVLSVFFNLIGRLSLAKIAAITAVQAIALSLALQVFFAIVIESLYLQFKAFSHRRLSGLFDFQQIQERSQGLVWVLGISAFIFSIARNLIVYDELISSLSRFINSSHTIGNMVFSFKSVAVFALIIFISFAISRFINFFFGSDTITDIKKKGRIGSLMLIIRLIIWILGFLVGVSAAGIPLDRLSLMIGAFGVGIGFGLQNIVNNLVSGVILAFERPIQVGDFIEVGAKSGVVQEIGVRSSKIENAEGAAIIIPNGDLLSQQLVNWTMHDTSRRLDFMLTLPLPSDIEKVRSLVIGELQKNEGVLQLPMPAIIMQDFQPNAIQMKIMWWIPDLHLSGAVRSAVMQKIYEALNTAGVAFEK